MKKILALLLVTLLLVGCGFDSGGSDTEPVTAEQKKAVEIEIPDIVKDAAVKCGSVSTEDAILVTLSDEGCSASGEGVSIEGSIVTFTEAGEYIVSGTLLDGQLRVDTKSSQKVKLILNGIDITCSDGPAIYILNAQKKVVLELAKDSVNLVEDGESYSDTSEDAPSATIFSKEDLDIDGEGTLYVTGNFCKGIFTKDDLSIEGGTLIIAAADDGIRGKDSVEMSGGSVTITAGGDGLRSSNETDDGKGYIKLSGGELYITAAQDGIQAVTDCSISNITLTVNSGGGSQNSSTKNEGWGKWGGEPDEGFSFGGKSGRENGGTPPSVPEQGDMPFGISDTQADETASAKGIKATGELVITGGKISIDSSDDALHSNGSISIVGGEIYVSSGDDGIHADSELNIGAGVITVEKSYEGLEALSITISGGDITVTASDDGINAAGGNDGSSLGERPGRNSFASDESGLVTITGGSIVLDASGDGLDSNGNIVQSGGSVLVFGPTSNGNGPLDYAGSYTLSGGSVLAVGSAGMAQTISDCAFGQVYKRVRAEAGSVVEISDADGTILASVTLPKAIECVVFAAPTVLDGETCSVLVDGKAV